MLDLLVHNATLPDGRSGMSIAVAGRPHRRGDGRPRRAGAREARCAAACCVAPPFVDAHFHMDATLSYGLPRVNESGTLLEGIALWGELKPQLTAEALVERALAYCDWAVAKGLLAIRSHVDICDPQPARGRCAARSEAARRALPRPAARRLPAGRRAALAGRRRQPEARARHGRRRGRRHPALRAHHGRRRRQREAAVRARRRARPAGRHALRRDRTTRCRATSRRWPSRRSASACRAASPARTAPRCIRWTTTTSPSCCR